MEKIFISSLTIEHVRHLKNITIPLSNERIKHLILTGKNGSGKTSVLAALSDYLNEIAVSLSWENICSEAEYYEHVLQAALSEGKEDGQIAELKKSMESIQKGFADGTGRIEIEFSLPATRVRRCFEKGQFILAYYTAERIFQAEEPKHIEKVELRSNYAIDENPRHLFVKYLADLKVTEALARNSGKMEKADTIQLWFAKFQDLLRMIFGDDSLELLFEEDTFSFSIQEKDKDIFDFNTLSSGFAAVLDIVLDIIIRMEKQTNKSFDFNVPGIVLIDEIETHLHIELQKTILKLLTTIFPNVQFILSTHSPFILNSIPDAVIYDLEKGTLVEDGLSDIPYGGIVEGYFGSSELSKLLEEKFAKYKMLVTKQELDDNDFEEIAELEMYLNEIPDYLALNITTEYQRLKMEFESREDI